MLGSDGQARFLLCEQLNRLLDLGVTVTAVEFAFSELEKKHTGEVLNPTDTVLISKKAAGAAIYA